MATLIQRVAVQAYQTFGKRQNLSAKQQNFARLKDLMNRVTVKDVCFDESLVKDTSPYKQNHDVAPVTYISVWADEWLTMGIFVLKNNTRLPLHDHPGMHGLVKVIHGSVTVRNFSRVEKNTLDEAACAEVAAVERRYARNVTLVREVHAGVTVDTSSDVVTLDPQYGNYHEIRATTGPAAFLDLLSPPYDNLPGSHPCSYYKAVPADVFNSSAEQGASPTPSFWYLLEMPTPHDYWSDSATYCGPNIDPYESTM